MTTTVAPVDVRGAVRAATLAPSVLNTQPWRFVAHSEFIDVHRDVERELPVMDPHHRALTVSCGAALYNLRVSVAAMGRRAVVDVLPDPFTPTWLARLRIGEQAEATAEQLRHAAAIPERRTSRVPFVDEPLAPEAVVRLEEAAREEGAVLHVLDAFEAYDVGRLVKEADLEQVYADDLRAEVRRWTRRPPTSPDGIPDAALGPVARRPSSLVRDFAVGEHVPQRGHAYYEREPTLAVLLSAGDRPADWLAAGQALERVWLEATSNGLAVSLLTQPLELPGLRWLTRPVSAEAPYPQALMRLGVALASTPATPRRPVEDVLTASTD